MRVSKAKAAENRERILDAAARLMRERGIAGAGVDALTEAAGMTHGSLYSQFGSKDQLIQEALEHAISASGKVTSDAATLEQYVAAYLSAEHRDHAGKGCPLAALVCEMPRQREGVRAKFTEGLKGMLARVSARHDAGLKPAKRDELALTTVASLVGALILARAVDDPELSNDILRATRKQLTG